MTAQYIARWVLSRHGIEHDDSMVEQIIWGWTGFPSFWPDRTKTPAENFYRQLDRAARAIRTFGWLNDDDVYMLGVTGAVLKAFPLP